ncbi:MAG: nif11-like peptide radical SAM maturase [Bacillota bacterium]|nr:nif11-like peptide radical SAM maturase [Bacillota bacterium]MDW7684996.1 nif11-like peptide radical SAM maturase [Bacillota bacterium]
MLLKPHHIFTYHGNNYLINVEEMKVFQIDKNTSMTLQKISLDPDFAISSKTEEELVRLELFVLENQEGKKRTDSRPNNTSIRNISLFITQNCNMRCTYCYGDGGGYGSSGNMELETARRSVDWLIEHSGEIKKVGISFFGGEPFLNFPLMKQVVVYAQKRSEEIGKEFEFSVTTNASMLDKKKIAFLKENKVIPLVSFDGSKKIQDAQRLFKNGRGSYDVVVPKIRQLLQVFPETTARATLVGLTDPVEVIRALHEIGFSSTHITVVSQSLFDFAHDKKKNLRNNHGMEQMMEVEAEELLKNVKCQNTQSLKKQKINGLLITRLGEFLNKQKKYFGCGAGRKFVGISTVGDVFLCHRFVGMDSYRLGNIFDRGLARDVYQKSLIKVSKKCNTCFAKYICGGGCYHENLGFCGSVFEPSEKYCRVIRYSMKMVAYVSSQLSDEDRDYMISEKIIMCKPCHFDFPV